MELYVVRHAQSLHNKYLSQISKDPENKEIQKPDIDTGLTEEGIESVKKAIHVLDDFCEYMYVAPLKRTLETAEIIKQAKFDHVPFEVNELIKEVNYGEVDGLTTVERKLKFGEVYEDDSLDFEKYGGESYESICKRIKEFFDLLKSRNHKKVIVVTSQGIIKVMYQMLVGDVVPTISKYVRVKNSTVHVFKI